MKNSIQITNIYKIKVFLTSFLCLIILFKPVSIKSQNFSIEKNYLLEQSIRKKGIKTTTQLSGQPVDSVNNNIMYFDGLGRNLQNVIYQGSFGKKDIVQFFEYDLNGKQIYNYLPYQSINTSGNYNNSAKTSQAFFYNDSSDKVADNTNPWAQTKYEDSPLSRTLQQGATGNVWQLNSGHIVSNSYQTNTANEVFNWNLQSTGLLTTKSSPYYAANSLFKTVLTSEEGKLIVTYKDKLDRMILKKVQVNTTVDNARHAGWACTYYIYDDYGNLRVVLTPEAIKSITDGNINDFESTSGTILNQNTTLSSPTTGSYYYLPGVIVTLSPNFDGTPNFSLKLFSLDLTDDFLNRWAYRYEYDTRNRLIKKKIPGADWIYFVYDNRDRLVLTQDGVQRAASPSKQWIFTKYDAMNRPIITGIYEGNYELSQMQSHVDSIAGGSFTWYETTITTGIGYTNTAFPSIADLTKYLAFTFYDNYDLLTLTEFTSSYDFKPDVDNFDDTYQSIVKGRITGGKIKNLDDNTWLPSVIYYDEKYRPIQQVSGHQLDILGYNHLYNLYDFSGNIVNSKLEHKENNHTTNIKERYSYDHANRLLNVWHQVDSYLEIMLVKNEYNEIGQLVDKKIHSANSGSTFLQSIDFRYNIRGWLTNINNSDLSNLASDDQDDPGDYFGMELGYNNDMGIDNSSVKYNGNISALKWSSKLALNGETERAYNFSYDNLNRITDANYKMKRGSWGSNTNALKEGSFVYDYNGNIQSLIRYKSDTTILDQLTYDYGAGTTKSNQLKSISDGGDVNHGFRDGNTSGNDYDYNANGSLIKDLNKGISSITYNILNLPQLIQYSNGNWIKYIYSASGTKLAQQIHEGSTTIRNDYVGNFIYKDALLVQVQTAEGRVLPKRDDNNNITGYEYQYYIKDHLGNTRMTISANPGQDEYLATFESNRQTEESSIFGDSYNTSYIIPNNIFDHTDAGTTYTKSLMLNGTDNRIVGTAITLRVIPGDTIKMEVYGKYYNPNSTNTNITANIANQILSAFSLPVGSSAEIQTAVNELSALFANGPIVGSDDWESATTPKAYLNYLLFDDKFNLVDYGIDQINESANQQSGTNPPIAPHVKMSLVVSSAITKPGYIYIYVSNENDKVTEVYFDDFKVTQVHSPVVQSSDYYPYGMDISENSYESLDGSKNRFKFNGKEQQDDLDLDWTSSIPAHPLARGSGTSAVKYDYGARMPARPKSGLPRDEGGYDAAIGRWMVVDPLAEKMRRFSPYNYAFNNPVIFIEPDGQRPWLFGWGGSNEASIGGPPTESGPTDSDARTGYREMASASDTKREQQKQKALLIMGLFLSGSGQGQAVGTNTNQEGQSEKNNSKATSINEQTQEEGNITTESDQTNKNKSNTLSDGGEYAPSSAYTKRGNEITWNDLWSEFKSGTGPERSLILSGKMIEDLKNSWIVTEARIEFLSLSGHDPLNRWDAPFGIFGLSVSHSGTEEFIGGARISIIPFSNGLIYQVDDTKDLNSLYLHIPKSQDRIPGQVIPYGTTYQRYIWWEPK